MRIIHTVRGVGFRISNELLDAAEEAAATSVPPTPGSEPEVETAIAS